MEQSLSNWDAHGCCSEAANFKSPTKRSFLNECIRQIYILNGKGVNIPVAPSPIEFNKHHILHMLNLVVQPTGNPDRQTSLLRVKRRLFRESKQRQRKARKPQRNPGQQLQLYHFKAVRGDLGVRKLRRHYMDEARQSVEGDLRLTRRKRKCTAADTRDTINIGVDEGVAQVSQHSIAKICKYHKNMARSNPKPRSVVDQQKRDRNTEACRLSRQAMKLEELVVEEHYRNHVYANERMLQESIRSLFYMKALLNLIVDREDNLYI